MFLWCFFIKRIKNQEVSSPLKTLLEMPMYFNNPRDGSYVWDDAYKNLFPFSLYARYYRSGWNTNTFQNPLFV